MSSSEGVARRAGVVVFADGHAEAKMDADINPPKNGSLVNYKYWDHLLRAGER